MLHLSVLFVCLVVRNCQGNIEVETFIGDGANLYTFSAPTGITFSPSWATAYVADSSNCIIREVDVSTKSLIGYIGLNCGGSSQGDYIDGPCSTVQFNSPTDLAMDTTNGIMYITDNGNSAVRSMTTTGTCVVHTVAGGGANTGDGVVIGGTTATFIDLWGIVIDLFNGKLYVCDRGDQTIKMIDISTSIVTTIAGQSGVPANTNGIGTNARFNNPKYLVVDSVNGYLYITCELGNTIRRLALSNNAVTTIAGNGVYGYANGVSVAGVEFAAPQGIALDPVNQILYVGDGGNNVIRAIALSYDAVTTCAGLPNVNGHQDGSSSVATFGYSFGGLVYNALDSQLYVCDADNSLVRIVILATNSGAPSGQPIGHPTRHPSDHPNGHPSGQPSNHPSGQPSKLPSVEPTRRPTAPSGQPSGEPSNHPSGQPTSLPNANPTSLPTKPSGQPSGKPSKHPSSKPSGQPSSNPSAQPSNHPSGQPSGQPSKQPSAEPTGQPSAQPTGMPNSVPSGLPTGQPSLLPTGLPSAQPSGSPTSVPSVSPSSQPTVKPSGQPTGHPSLLPTGQPSNNPSSQPSTTPTAQPTEHPTGKPSRVPTGQPSGQPTARPTYHPSGQPTGQPTETPTPQPSGMPTVLTQNNDDDGGFSFPELGAIISIPIALILLALVYYARSFSSSSFSPSSSTDINTPNCDSSDTSERDVELVVALRYQDNKDDQQIDV